MNYVKYVKSLHVWLQLIYIPQSGFLKGRNNICVTLFIYCGIIMLHAGIPNEKMDAFILLYITLSPREKGKKWLQATDASHIVTCVGNTNIKYSLVASSGNLGFISKPKSCASYYRLFQFGLICGNTDIECCTVNFLHLVAILVSFPKDVNQAYITFSW